MIKMRNNKDVKAVCCECKDTADNVLNMFDICIGGKVFTLCDKCNADLFSKTLKADCYKNSRIKSSADIDILRKRKSKLCENTTNVTINEAMKSY